MVLKKMLSSTPVFRIISPNKNSNTTMAICSFAKPERISVGVSILKIPSTAMPMVKVNPGPIQLLYMESIMNRITMITI